MRKEKVVRRARKTRAGLGLSPGAVAKALGGAGMLLLFAAGCTEEGREAQMLITGATGVVMTLPMLAVLRKEELHREREDREEFHRCIDRAVRNI